MVATTAQAKRMQKAFSGDKAENCFPMIPSGKAHNEMILNDYLGETGAELGAVIDEKGKMLV